MIKHLLSAALFAAGALTSGPTYSQETAGLATSAPGSFYHTMGTVMAATLADKSSIQMRVQPFASPNIHLPVINAGQMEFGLANIYEVGLAIGGEDYFKGRENPNLRLVTITTPLRAGIFVRKDASEKSIADLRGKRVPWRFPQQNTMMPLMLTHFDAFATSEEDLITVPVATVVRAADEFMAGRLDAFMFALGSAKTAEVDAAVGGIRVLPLPDTPDARASIARHFPPSYVAVIKPRKGLAGIHEPTPVQHYDGVMVTHANAPDDLVYQVTKALWDNAKFLASGTPVLADFSQSTMAKSTDPVQYHPGAIKFYRERGVWPGK